MGREDFLAKLQYPKEIERYYNLLVRRYGPIDQGAEKAFRTAAQRISELPQGERTTRKMREILTNELKKTRSSRRLPRKAHNRVKGARTGKGKGSFKPKGRALTAVALAVVLGLGTTAALINDSKQNGEKLDSTQLEQLVNNQEELERLGISERNVTEIQEIAEIINSGEIDSYSEEELLELGKRIDKLQLSTIKEKLSDVLQVPEDKIVVSPDYNDGAPKGVVGVRDENGKTIKSYRSEDTIFANYFISGEISDYIVNIANTQTANARLEDGILDPAKAKGQYKTAMRETIEIAGKEIVTDKEGRTIKLEPVSKEQIDEIINDDDGR